MALGDLRRLTRLLRACWDTFDVVAAASKQLALKTGPRGGGRDLAKMLAHIEDGDRSYLASLGGPQSVSASWPSEIRELFVEMLNGRSSGTVPDRGPRGGRRWPTRYAIRRSARHALDHAWEIEDRSS